MRRDAAAGSARPGSANTLLAVAISAALCSSPQALAQQAQQAQKAGSDLTLEEIVVTATKRKENIQDVAQSISVLSTQAIEKAGFREMSDYVKALPSVTLAQSEPGRNSVVFRGISTGTDQFYSDAQAAVYFDEQPLTTNSQQVSPWLVDIERVEALPGPQGTLFGSSAETGTLRIIANKPDPSGFSGQYSVNGFATKGGASSYEADGHVNVPLIDQKLTARIVGFVSDHGGWIDNVTGPDLAGGTTNAQFAKNNWNTDVVSGGRVAALWDITDRTNVLFNVMQQSEDTKGDWLSDPYLGDSRITRFANEFRNDDWWQAAMTLTADLGFAELKSASAYFHRHIVYETDNMTYEQYKTKLYGAAYYGNNLYNTRLVSNGAYTTSVAFNDQHQERISQEIRLTSTGQSKLQWIGGLFYERVHDDWFYGARGAQYPQTYSFRYAQTLACKLNSQGYKVQCPLPATPFEYVELFDRVVKQTAAFGELTYNLTDRWSVTGGARWFKYDRDTSDAYTYPQGVPVIDWKQGGVPFPANVSSGSDSNTLFKIGTKYKYSRDGMVYLLYSQGFRLGGANSARAAQTGLIPLRYKPDQLNNYEAGIKSQWLDRRLTLNASIFLMQWKDVQLEDSGFGPFWLRGTSNGGGAEAKGIELSGAMRATRQLSLDFNLTAADHKLTSDFKYAGYDPANPATNNLFVPSGTVMPNAPRFKAAAGIEYALGWKPFGGRLWTRFDYSYQSSLYQDIRLAAAGGSEGKIDAWSTGKLQLGLNLPSGLDLTLTADNIWNERGANWIQTYEGPYAAKFGDPRYHDLKALFRPQNIGLSIRKSF